jgi:hypothetical protein
MTNTAKYFEAFFIAIGQSTYVSDVAQLVLFIRGCDSIFLLPKNFYNSTLSYLRLWIFVESWFLWIVGAPMRSLSFMNSILSATVTLDNAHDYQHKQQECDG